MFVYIFVRFSLCKFRWIKQYNKEKKNMPKIIIFCEKEMISCEKEMISSFRYIWDIYKHVTSFIDWDGLRKFYSFWNIFIPF